MAGNPTDTPKEIARLANYLARRFATGETLAEARERSPLRFAGLSDADVDTARRLGRTAAEAYTDLYAFGPEEPIEDTHGGAEVLAQGGAAQILIGYGREVRPGVYETYRTFIVAITPGATRGTLEDAAREAALGGFSPGVDEAFSSAELQSVLPFNPDDL